MKVFLDVLKPALPLFYAFFILSIAWGAFRVYQIYSLRKQAGTKRVEGVAGNSLATEKKRIRKEARAKGLRPR